jgi:hypothetical protein
MSKRKKKYHGPKIVGQWVPHPVAMIRVLRELSLTARRILDTLEIENCRHSGKENGNLISTYDDFETFVQRSSIRKALDELVAAGLIEITELGRRAYADLRSPSLYRLTYLHSFQNGKWIEPTHEWKKKQNTRPDSTTGTRPESTTGNGQLPDRNPPLQGGNYQAGIHHSYLDNLGEEGGGGAADLSCLPAKPPAPSQEGMGPSAPSPPSFDDQQLPSVTAPSSGRLH